MNDKVVIAGTVKLRNTIKAKTNLHNVINGTPSWVVNTGGGGIVYPHYTGSYIVTPSGSVQTLGTSDKVMDDDVTIQAMTQGSATTPATIITADPTISVSSGGLITATVSKTQQITPTVQEGYVSAGTPGNVGVSGSNTQQLTVQSAQTIHPASTDQSIASGKYLTGAQTFKAVTVSGLTADKVLQGTTVEIGDSDDSDRIMKVVGTASGGITPTGTKQISITQNGTTTEDVTNYASAEITVNVSGGGVVDGYGKPYTIMMGGPGSYSYTGSDIVYWDTANPNNRRSIWASQGTTPVKKRASASDYSTDSNLYPIEIPNGATKLSLTPSNTIQTVIFFTKYQNGWLNVSSSGWVNMPVVDYTIPSGVTHIAIGLRVNSSNTNFSATTQPTYVDITFS